MKEINRIIGAVVVILAIAVFVLSKLNGMGFINGSLGKWTSNVVYHISAIKDDTGEFLYEQGILKTSPVPTAKPSSFEYGPYFEH